MFLLVNIYGSRRFRKILRCSRPVSRSPQQQYNARARKLIKKFLLSPANFMNNACAARERNSRSVYSCMAGMQLSVAVRAAFLLKKYSGCRGRERFVNEKFVARAQAMKIRRRRDNESRRLMHICIVVRAARALFFLVACIGPEQWSRAPGNALLVAV